MSDVPNLFISYSWTNPSHEQWVLDLASRLTEDGVHVILDKWDLREGQDAHEFMEQMVTKADIKKVAIICDKEYVRRADERERGVGTETRLITGAIYKSDEPKFVAVITEKDEDGSPYVPAYYSGRIHIDLAESSHYEEQYERLVRWVYDKPLYSRPARGKAPSFLDDKTVARIGNSSDLRRALDQLKEGKPNASATLGDYLVSVSDAFESLRLDRKPEEQFDDKVIDSIASFLPTRENLINVVRTIARYQPTEENLTKLHRFFERLIPFMATRVTNGMYFEDDCDNYKYLIHELFLYTVAILLDEERFQLVGELLAPDFVIEPHHAFGNERLVSPSVFMKGLPSLETRNRRLNLQKQSLQAELLKQRAQSSGVPFLSLAQADIVIFLALQKRGQPWWPETSVYVNSFVSRVCLPIFARAASRKYFEKLRPLLGGESLEQFKARVVHMHQTNTEPMWNRYRVLISPLVSLDTLGTKE